MKDNGLYMAVAVTEAVSGERGHGLAEAVAEGQGGAEGQGHGPAVAVAEAQVVAEGQGHGPASGQGHGPTAGQAQLHLSCSPSLSSAARSQLHLPSDHSFTCSQIKASSRSYCRCFQGGYPTP